MHWAGTPRSLMLPATARRGDTTGLDDCSKWFTLTRATVGCGTTPTEISSSGATRSGTGWSEHTMILVERLPSRSSILRDNLAAWFATTMTRHRAWSPWRPLTRVVG